MGKYIHFKRSGCANVTLDFKTSGKKWALLVIRGMGARPFCGSVVVVNGEDRELVALLKLS